MEKQDVEMPHSQKVVCEEFAERSGDNVALREKLAKGVAVQRRISVASGN